MIKPKISVEVKNTAVMDRLLKEMPKLKKAYVTVGFHGDAGSYDDGTDVVEVAFWNEFGTRKMPQRSFIRTTIDENIDKINKWREEALVNIIEKGMDSKKALDTIGFNMMVLIQNKIKSNVPPPNSDFTRVQKKKMGFPQRTLIATGTMLRSVTFRTVIP